MYKKNFLDRVVFRVDFEPVDLKLIGKFKEKIQQYFPNSQSKKGESGVFTIDLKTKEVQQQSSPLTAWVFQDAKGEVSLEVSERFLCIVYRPYMSSVNLMEHIAGVVVPFFDFFQVNHINRVGLRYLNVLELDGTEYFEWSDYLDDNLLGTLSFARGVDPSPTRVMGQSAFRREDCSLMFNFGIWNDNFPGAVLSRKFVLDYDCHSIFPMTVSEIDLVTIVKSYSDFVQEVFELSIKKGYRDLMGQE